MITIKVPYKTTEDNALIIKDLQRQYSCVVRSAYNRAKEGTLQKDIRLKLKSLSNVSDLGSWLTQCAILDGLTILKKNKDKKVIFGGVKNFMQRIKNKLNKEELKQKRLLSINIQGEKQLQFIEQMSLTKDLTITVRLNDSYVYFTYEEPVEKVELNQQCYMGIDLNPNYIGISIKENEKILHTECFDFSALTDKLLNENNSSDSKRFKYLNNKLKHETILTAKQISLIAKKFNCRFVFIEELKNISLANLDKGHTLNRLCKNLWKRDYFVQT